MSFYPLYTENERANPRQLMDEYFELDLTPSEYLTLFAVPQDRSNYCRQWRNLQAANRYTGSTIKEDKTKFQIYFDVQEFAPDEISVKVVDDFLVVEAKHEGKRDEHGFISRSFTRKYLLPEDVEDDLLTSKLSSDGVLTIVAPLKAPPKSWNERIVPIIQTGPVRKTDGYENQY